MGLLAALADPDIGQYLLRDEDEVVVDEVRHHWVAYTKACALGLAAVAMAVVTLLTPVGLGWFTVTIAGLLGGRAVWLALVQHMDRFVITNMRVFRAKGVIDRQAATMPLSRILDITVTTPLLGRLLGYGHFCFESAAQEQGLRDIRFVARPRARDQIIQSVVQRAGLRGPRVPN